MEEDRKNPGHKVCSKHYPCKFSDHMMDSEDGYPQYRRCKYINVHYRFSITCWIELNSELAELLQNTRLIVWDELPMAHCNMIEALDRTLKKQNKFYNGKYKGQVVKIQVVNNQGIPMDVCGLYKGFTTT
eukprot:m51a1_g10867 putative helicase-like protein (130) ;mRNA; f:2931-15594